MDDSVRFGLRAKAEAIAQFRDLEVSEQEWLMPLLSRGIRSTMELLDLISEKTLTFEEIADELGINPQTAQQKCNALAAGGYPLQLSETSAYAPTGRPRKLIREK